MEKEKIYSTMKCRACGGRMYVAAVDQLRCEKCGEIGWCLIGNGAMAFAEKEPKMKAKDIKSGSKSFIQWAEAEELARRLKGIDRYTWVHSSEEGEISTAELYELYLEERMKLNKAVVEKKALDVDQLLMFLEEKMKSANLPATAAYTIVYDYVKNHI